MLILNLGSEILIPGVVFALIPAALVGLLIMIVR